MVILDNAAVSSREQFVHVGNLIKRERLFKKDLNELTDVTL
jgi:hypothetical protein